MNRFEKKSKGKKIAENIPFAIIYFVIALVIFVLGISFISNKHGISDKQILNEALEKDIAHCYAVEGSYPPSVTYLEEKYGLTYNHDKFLIDYEIIGSNIYPNVMIVEK